ncbi:MAG: SGNH hydrolase domain-containing protein, partial [Methylococcus sp.]|nr:SGNH hydrolase domain-containing protein [Methylococcus sp.]
DDLIREVSRRDSGVCTVFPEQALCTGGYCVPQRDGLTLYVDDDHLSQSGAEWLMADPGIRAQLDACLGVGNGWQANR